MNEIEYIQKWGWRTFQVARGFVNTRKFLVVYTDELDFVDVIKPHHGKCVFKRSIVNRLVDSLNFVSQFETLQQAKEWLYSLTTNGLHTIPSSNLKVSKQRLNQAILDIESINKKTA